MSALKDKTKQLETLGYQMAEYRPNEGALYLSPKGQVVTIFKNGKTKPGNHLSE